MGLVSPNLAGPNDYFRTGLQDQLRYYRSAQISSQEAAPDMTEIVFSGILKGQRLACSLKATFVIRVVKERNGKWFIRYCSLRNKEEQQIAE